MSLFGRILKFKHSATAVIVISGLAVMLLANGGKSPESVTAKSDFLHVCQDDKQLEKNIAGYIERTHGVKAALGVFRNNPDDVYLRYSLEPDKSPQMNLSVDTRVTNRSSDNSRVTERSIRFYCFFVLPDEVKTAELRRKLLELNNRWHSDKWMPGRIYLDKQGDIAMETIINIPGENIPLHGEICFDIMARMSKAWSQYYRELKKLKVKLK